jgi:hypothetical protein
MIGLTSLKGPKAGQKIAHFGGIEQGHIGKFTAKNGPYSRFNPGIGQNPPEHSPQHKISSCTLPVLAVYTGFLTGSAGVAQG